MRWVLAYDVRSNSARRRVARRLEQVGFRKQLSVFEGELDPGSLRELLDELSALLTGPHDQLAAWPSVDGPDVHLEVRGYRPEPTRADWRVL